MAPLEQTVRAVGKRQPAELARWVWVLFLLAAACQTRPPYEGKSVAELARQLERGDANQQAQAAFGLSRHGVDAAAATPALAAALQHPNALVRANAALALAEVGPPARAAVPALVEALKDKEWTVRRHAARALGRIGADARAAVGVLKTLARQDPEELVRRQAASAVAELDR